MVVGRLLSYWEGNFLGAMLNFGRVFPKKKSPRPQLKNNPETIRKAKMLKTAGAPNLGFLARKTRGIWVVFSHPFEKYAQVKMEIFPKVGMRIKNIKKYWNHHLAGICLQVFFFFWGGGGRWNANCWWFRKSGEHQLRLVVEYLPLFTGIFFYIPGGDCRISEPSTVVGVFFTPIWKICAVVKLDHETRNGGESKTKFETTT